MCGTCGCGKPDAGPPAAGAHAHAGAGSPTRVHAHAHGPGEARRVAVERSLLEANEARAEALRKRLAQRGVEAIGLLGGPGAGKTALLEATLARLGAAASREAVVEGDCATDRDARRVAAAGARAVQVVTGAVCHLDAHMIEHALEGMDLEGVSRLWIENVGNLVCPAPFACGESRRAVLVSVTEGDDKPEKYPALFATADLLVVSKIDLLPHVDFDLARCVAAARRARPGLAALACSAKTGEGLDAWLAWLRGELA
jgi:hydrogenase nickel incorporation protein HypB